MTRLKTCQACSRHVFVSEVRCPFCGAVCAEETRAPIFDIKAGMSRAQRFAVVAAVAGQTALIGCNADDPPGGGGAGAAGMAAVGGGAGTAGGGGAQPVYGAPVQPGQSGTGGSAGGVAVPVYGAPVPPDAGTAGRGGSAGNDGGTAGSGGSAGGGSGKGGGGAQPVCAPVPAYGLPPPSK